VKFPINSAANASTALWGVLLASALPAFAQGPGWTVNSVIVSIVDTGSGGVNVRLSPELSGCESQSGYGASYASLYPSHAGINRIKATLLTAYVTGSPIALYLGDNTCTISEVELGGR
jgi:hypothetical protein